MKEERKLDDAALELINGGVMFDLNGTSQKGMEQDPLFQKFLKIWEREQKTGLSGIDSQIEFMDAFRKWVKAGVPDQLMGLNAFARK